MANTTSQYAFSDAIGAGSPVVASNLPVIDYTAWDYPAIKRFLTRLAKAHFGNKYNNFVESDFGIMLLEYLAAHGDFISMKADYLMNEAIMLTASLPKNVRRHARSRGYRPRPRLAARYDFTVSVVQAYTVDIVIQSGFTIQTSAPDGRILAVQIYKADEDGNPLQDEPIVLSAGLKSISDVVGVEGERKSTEASGFGQRFQIIRLPEGNILPTSIQVRVDGELWTEVETILDQGPEKVYRVDQEARSERWFIVCGDGARGAVFPDGAVIDVSYRVGGGSRGNLSAGFINVNEIIAVPESNLAAPVTFVNRSRGRGGDDGESSQDIRANITGWNHEQFRILTLDDYTTYSNRYWKEGVGRVGKGRAYLRHAGCSANIIELFLVELGVGQTVIPPSDRLMSAIATDIEPIKDAVHHLCVRPGRIVYVDTKVFANFPKSYASRKTEAESLVAAAMAFYFDLRLWTFGRPLKPKEAEKTVTGSTPAVDAKVSFFMDPGFQLESDGSYNALRHELVRPRPVEINISFTGDVYQ